MMNSITNERLYTMAEAAKKLNIKGVGSTNLYYYLKTLKIINSNNTPDSRFIELGYFQIKWGSKNHNASEPYAKTVVTEKGLRWLLEEIKPQILEEQKKYFDNYKK